MAGMTESSAARVAEPEEQALADVIRKPLQEVVRNHGWYIREAEAHPMLAALDGLLSVVATLQQATEKWERLYGLEVARATKAEGEAFAAEARVATLQQECDGYIEVCHEKHALLVELQQERDEAIRERDKVREALSRPTVLSENRRLTRDLAAARERETRLREALERIAGLRVATAFGPATEARKIARAALVVSSPQPGAPLTEPERKGEADPRTLLADGRASAGASPCSGSVSVSPPPVGTTERLAALDTLENLIGRAERDSMLLNGRDHADQRFAEAIRLIALLRAKEQQRVSPPPGERAG